MSHFPLFADLGGQPCLVVGGGEVAARKVARLLLAAADVTVNAPELCANLADLAANGRIRHAAGGFDPALVRDRILIIAATSDRQVNERVAKAARDAMCLCNVVDDAELSTCIMPAVVNRDPLVIAVGSNGHSPVLARRLRQQIEAWLPARIGELAAWAGRWRGAVGAKITSPAARLRFWESVFAGAPAERVLAGDSAAADDFVRGALDCADRECESAGVAWFVGAGPGDPGLITQRGLQLLQTADVVLHDRLVSIELLDHARRDARVVDVGKSPGAESTPQRRTNALLLEFVSAGHRVCRLKGGDPFVFGRGGEEVAAVAAAGHAYEIVPGITAAIGCAAAARIPLTHREFATGVTLVTGHRAESTAGDEPDTDWAALARGSQTLAIYMGARRLPDICRDLIRGGRAPTTPAAIIENGTTADERIVGGTLADIAARAESARVRPPALLIVGDVIDAADKLRWHAGGAEAEFAAAVASS